MEWGNVNNKKVHSNRGVRQAEPLSSFLFIITMKGLHVVMETTDLQFYGVSLPNDNPTLFHLIYTDDVLFMEE